MQTRYNQVSKGGQRRCNALTSDQTDWSCSVNESYHPTWEVNWTHPENTGSFVMARNPLSRLPKVREWHMTSTATLRRAGINTPKYRRDSWEVDWSKRNGKLVWARNPQSKIPSAREWHWVDHHTLNRAGVKWKPIEKTDRGRHIASDGYVVLTLSAMTDDEIALCNEHGIWNSKTSNTVKEHRLVALKEYGHLPKGHVVRHINGCKTDNRPENLVLGSHKENCRDHEEARIMAMYWREKYEKLKGEMES